MIARIWAGATRAADADPYLDYLHATGFPEYRATPGNRGVLALRRVVGDHAEFVLVTLWDSDEAIRRFAGDDIEQAVFYPEDERVLVDRGERVRHYEVVYQAEEVAP
jgi:heme-degrading monooxygenase HmoA